MFTLPDVEDVTKLVNEIPKLNEVLGEAIKTPTGVVIFLLTLVWLIKSVGALRFLEFFGRRSRNRTMVLEKYIANSEQREPQCVAVVRDLSDAEHFHLATRIYAEKLRRIALIDLHDRVQHKVTWRGIRQALQYYEYSQNGMISIRAFTIFDKLGYRYNQLMMGLGLLGSVALICLLLLTQQTELRTLVVLAGIPLAILISGFSAYQNLPEYFAKKISFALAELPSAVLPIETAAGEQSTSTVVAAHASEHDISKSGELATV